MGIRTYRGVQALRFVIALGVVTAHAGRWFNRDAGSTHHAPELQGGGILLVWSFFLISGFVIALVVDSGREPDWKAFAIRRATRILPLAWAMTAVKIVAALATPAAMNDGSLTPTRIIASFLLVPSRDPAGHFRTLWGVEWTLVLEAAFYVLVAVALALRVDPVRLLTPILIVIAVLAIWRPDGGSVLWFYADPVLLFLVVGMWIGRATRTGKVWSTLVASLGLMVLYAVIQAARQELTLVIGMLAFAGLAGAFALLIASERQIGSRIPNWVVLGGEAGFAIYLTHPLVAQALPRLLGKVGGPDLPWWPVVLASIALSVVLGWVVHTSIDMPLGRALRRRLVPRSAVPAPRAAD